MDFSRLEDLLQKKNVSLYTLSRATGIPPSTFTDWKTGRSSPKIEKLIKIANYFEVSLDDLLGLSPREVLSQVRIPIVGHIRAGLPIVTNETLVGYEYADVKNAEDYFYLQITGDSMKNCGILDGSLVLFHKQTYAENGDIVACLTDADSATIKRFYRDRGEVLLVPENEAYETRHIPLVEFEMGTARILGKAISVKTNFCGREK